MSASTRSNTGSDALSAGGRNPAWWSSAASPSVFSATVLPPGVRPADHERAQLAEVEVDGDGGGRLQQRVARAEQAHLLRPLDRRSPPAARDDAARDGEVDLAGRLDEGGDLLRGGSDAVRQLAQDPLDLLALCARGLGLHVVELDDLERLDEEGLARRGRVVDDAGDTATGARLHREHRGGRRAA